MRTNTAVRADSLPFDIEDPGLAKAGRGRIDWAARSMPVLKVIGSDSPGCGRWPDFASPLASELLRSGAPESISTR